MKNFPILFSLLFILTFTVFAQDSVEEISTDKSLSFAQKTSEVKTISTDNDLSFAKKTPEVETVKLDFTKEFKIDQNEAIKTINKKDEKKKDQHFTPRKDSSDEYNKNEFFVGYSYQNIDEGTRQHLNGFNVAYVYNFSRYVGIKGDFSGAYGSDTFSFTVGDGTNTFTNTITSNTQQYYFLGGVQFKDNASEKTLKPFAHTLFGAAHLRVNQNSSCSGACGGTSGGSSSISRTYSSLALGGGLDIKINDKIDFRAIQADYNPGFFFGDGVIHNFRFGVGIVFK